VESRGQGPCRRTSSLCFRTRSRRTYGDESYVHRNTIGRTRTPEFSSHSWTTCNRGMW
jgi:hypothetical protein